MLPEYDVINYCGASGAAFVRGLNTLITFLVLANSLLAGDTESNAEIVPFVQAHCTSCHDASDPAGGLSLQELVLELDDAENARRWELVHDRVAAGEMPPHDTTQPSRESRKAFLSTLHDQLYRADSARRQVVLRRLNRFEYQNTVRALFHTDVMVNGLPEDASTNGFDTVGEGLAVSAEAMQAYLDAAEQVLDAVFGAESRPKYIRHETNLLDQVDWKGRPQLDSQIGRMFRRTDDGLVIFQSGYCPTNLVNFSRLRAPAGTYRGTLKVRAIQSEKPVTLRIYGGDTIVNRRERHLVGYFDVPPGDWTTIEFKDRLVEEGGTFLPKCYGTRDTRQNADTYPEPGIEIGDIVIEGPLEAWPPQSRTQLLEGVEVDHAGTVDARRILNIILPRAFRRPVDETEVNPFLTLFDAAVAEGRSFESALRVSLTAVLCSPEFLFLEEPGAPEISQHALATRLAYFLTSSMPDDTLLRLADSGSLVGDHLSAQVDRLIDSPASKEFTRNFCGQWLDLRDINFTEPDANLYPEFDELLRISMLRETELFFEHVLRNDLNVVNFVDADFTFLNERLARHYGIDGVDGQAFRKVALKEDSMRGGLLTQASILKVTANGTYTSPVLRGAWVLENILGTPTSPPPDNVGSVEPDIRGATTIREQLALHRSTESCAACHARIDPPGFVLECFDPIGGYRERYRTMADDAPRPEIKQAPFTFAWVRYRVGPPVDSTFQLADGSGNAGIREFRKHLATQPRTLAANLTRKLLTYALGRKVGFADRDSVRQIVRNTGDLGYGLRSLIHAIVASPVFVKP